MRLLSAVTEVSVLKAACSENRLVSSTVLASLNESWFGLESSRELYRVIRASIGDTGDIPQWQAVLEAPGLSKNAKRAVLSVQDKIKRPQNKAHASSLVSTLNKYRKLRQMSEIYELVGNALESDKADVESLINDVADKLSDARAGGIDVKNQFATLGKGNNSVSVIKSILSGTREKFTPTGFEPFDKKNGGFLDGSLVVLGANTGGGKTSAAASMLNRMSYDYGIDTCVVSLEMSKQQMLSRLMAIRAEVPLHKVSSGQLSMGEKKAIRLAYRDFVAKCKEHGSKFTIWEPENDITIEEALLTVQPLGYKVVVVDYISLLKGTDGDDQWKQLNRVARYAKVFAKTNNMIVVLLVQVADDGKIKFAKSIADHANNAWLWVAPKESEDVSIYDVTQIKARNQLRFKMRFESNNITGHITAIEGGAGDREDGGDLDENGGYEEGAERRDVNEAD